MNTASPSDKELPVLRVVDFLTDPAQDIPKRLVSPNRPRRFLLEAQEFVHYFNAVLELHGSKAMTRRTVQFYTSPQAQVFPPPIYKNRHTAHYIYPDHFYRLCVILTLRKRLFMPVKLIRTVLQDLPFDRYDLVIQWDGSAEELLEMLPFLKQGFDHEDFFIYQAAKGLLTNEVHLPGLKGLPAADMKRHLLDKLDHECEAIRSWIKSDRGVRFMTALVDAKTSNRGPREHRQGHHGARRGHKK